MISKKYFTYILAVVFLCRCQDQKCTGQKDYLAEEEKEFFTQNLHKLEQLDQFSSILVLKICPEYITKLREKLADRSPQWLATGREAKPFQIWTAFYKEAVSPMIQTISTKHRVPFLQEYYNNLGELFKESTQLNEKKVIESIKKLQPDADLTEAVKQYIAEKYSKPETIYVSKPLLEYQEFLYFILNDPTKNNTLHTKLKKLQYELKKWKEDGNPTGRELWQAIKKNHGELLKRSPLYRYKENQEAIQRSLILMDQIQDDFYRLTYRDLLEILPHGTKKRRQILAEPQFKNIYDTKLMNKYDELSLRVV